METKNAGLAYMIANKVIAVVLSAASIVLAVSCSNGGLKKKASVKSPVKVRVQSVASKEDVSEKTYVARIAASKNATVNAPFPSTLTSLKVKHGSKVKAGQVLAVVSSETVDNSLAASKATLNQAQDAYDRLQKVKDNGSVAPLKLVEVETALSKAKAAYSVAEKSAADCYVKAPFSGTVSGTFAEVGENLIVGQPLVSISDLDGMEVLISVPESEIVTMKTGARANLTVPALGDAQADVRLIRRGVSASAVSHNYECAMELVKPLPGLMPGMVGKVVFSSSSADSHSSAFPSGKENSVKAPSVNSSNSAMSNGGESGSIVVPSSVVRTDESGRYVWTVDENDIVRKVRISVGGFSGKGIVVESGLSEGDRIIVDGSSKVSSGMKVEVEE